MSELKYDDFKFIEKYKDKLNFNIIVDNLIINNKLENDFIVKYKNYINWKKQSIRLTEFIYENNLIEEFKDIINWDIIKRRTDLSGEIIKKYANYLDFTYLHMFHKFDKYELRELDKYFSWEVYNYRELNRILKYQDYSQNLDILDKHFKYLDYEITPENFRYQTLSEEFIEKHIEFFISDKYFINSILSQDSAISKSYSKGFIFKYRNYIDLKDKKIKDLLSYQFGESFVDSIIKKRREEKILKIFSKLFS